MYSFPMAAITNYHKLSGLNQHTCVILHFYRSESRNELCKAKVKGSAYLAPSGDSGGRIHFLAFLSF